MPCGASQWRASTAIHEMYQQTMTDRKRTFIISLGAALVAVWSSTASFALDYRPALKLWHQQAERGDATAQKNLGDFYANGWSVTKNLAEAMKWYRKAADQNNAGAQFQIGELYESGKGLKQDLAQAYMWFTLAAVAGDRPIVGRLKMLTEKLTSQQIAAGKQLVSDWNRTHAPSTVKLSSTEAQTCTPSAGDFKVLVASPSHLTPDAFSSLTPAQKKMVCDTRDFIKLVDAQKGVMNEMGHYSTKYLSPAENDRMVGASNDYFSRIMKSKGF